MRGRKKEVKSLKLTGNVYLKYEHEEHIEKALKGDLMLYLNNDADPRFPSKGGYFNRGAKGYFKADIFDGKEWQLIFIDELCENKENHFSKSEIPVDVYNLCQEILISRAGTELYRSYRGHYTTYLHEMNEYKGKKGQVEKK